MASSPGSSPSDVWAIRSSAGPRAPHSPTLRCGHPPHQSATSAAELFARARTQLCFTALAELLADRTTADVYDVDAAERERLTRLMERDADIPIVRHRQPVFIAQGTADTVVYPPASKTTADQLAAAGTDVTSPTESTGGSCATPIPRK